MKKIKNLILSLVLACVCATFAFSSDVSVLLDKAKNDYAQGNLSAAITAIESARKIIDSEQLGKSDGSYIEVTNWDVVKLKKDLYFGKKVKITTKYSGIFGTDSIMLQNVSGFCKFDESLVDKILSLGEYTTHTFYGTVKKDSWSNGPEFFIEKIE